MREPAERRVTVSYALYLLRCADGSLYTGIATDPERRLAEHESSPRGAKRLRGRGPLTLVFSQTVGDRGRAQALEACVKRLPRRDKLRLAAGTLSLAEIVRRCRGICRGS